MLKKIIKNTAVLGLAVLAGGATAQAAENDGSWVGLIKKEDARNVSFIAGGKKYEIEGAKEAELLQYDSQRVRISGRLDTSAGNNAIQVSQVETFNDDHEVPAANRSDVGNENMRMNLADTEAAEIELDPSSPADTR